MSTSHDAFDKIADTYDRVRPGYPEDVYARILAFSGAQSSDRILEVGVGTAKATVPFARRGYQVEGIEPGPSLAAIARLRVASYPKVTIRTTRFEDSEVEGGAFAVAYCAQAFHWLDPDTRLARFAAALRGHGTLALFGHVGTVATSAIARAVQDVYERKAPALFSVRPAHSWYASTESPIMRELTASDAFTGIGFEAFDWEQTLSGDTYCALLSTYSDHSTLAPAELASLLAEIATAIADHGGTVPLAYRTGLFLARAVHG